MDSTVKSSVGNNRGQAMAQKAEQSKIGENNQTSNNKSSNEMESRVSRISLIKYIKECTFLHPRPNILFYNSYGIFYTF